MSEGYYSSDEAGVGFAHNPTLGETAGGEFGGQYVLVRNSGDLDASVKKSAENAHKLISEIHEEIASIKRKWLEVMKWYYGKTTWHNKMKTDNARPWVTKLQELSSPTTNPEDSLLTHVTAGVSGPTLWHARRQVRTAKEAIQELITTDETSEMGEHLDSATEALTKALGLIKK